MCDEINLRELSLLDALDLAVIRSGKSRVKVAEEMGWKWPNANRIFSTDDYWPTLPSIPRLCAVLGNTILLDWLGVQAAAGGLRFTVEQLDCPALVLRMGVLFRELGEVARVGEEAIKSGDIDKGEARRLIRELVDVANEALATINGLRGIAGDPVCTRSRSGCVMRARRPRNAT